MNISCFGLAFHESVMLGQNQKIEESVDRKIGGVTAKVVLYGVVFAMGD